MPKYKFSELNIREQKRYHTKNKKQKEHSGIDTETYHGYCKLICDSYGEYKEVDGFNDVLLFLCSNRFRNKFNWFYNIKFDFEAIIKHLDKSMLVDLYTDKFLVYQGFKINYLDRKFFSIQTPQKTRYYFFDMYNFLDTSLDKASKTLLHEQKLTDIIDSSKLNTDKLYWKNNRENIIKYCIQDAVLTKKLADYFWSMVYTKMDYIPKKPFSKGKISEEYFSNKIWIPTINDIPKKVLEYAYNSYSGGRFEILQRGYFPEIYSYDIKSAYPAEIKNLLDYSKGEWNKVKELDINSDGGFYKCAVSVYENNVSPIMIKYKNVLNTYPNGRYTLYLTKNEILFIRKYFPKIYLEVIEGYEFLAYEYYYPFKDEIDYLYQWKETEKNPDIKYCVKIILNSLYGKTIQAIGGNTGKLFNPLWAANITANTRIKLLEFCYPDYDNVIAFSTDSVKSTKPIQCPNNPKLGDFEKDFSGEGVYVMSDVYTFWNDKTGKQKNKFRGFSLAIEKDFESEEDISLLQILKNMNDTEYTYTTKRVYHLGECLLHTHKRTLNDLNIFTMAEKTLNINGDLKRIWERDFKNGKDVIENRIKSKPIMLS